MSIKSLTTITSDIIETLSGNRVISADGETKPKQLRPAHVATLTAKTNTSHLNSIEPDHRSKNINTSRLLSNANMQSLEISGRHNRCWLRSIWFSIFQDALKSPEKLGQLEQKLQHLTQLATHETSGSLLRSKLTENPNWIQDTLLHVINQPNSASLDQNGDFPPDVETLIYETTLAGFKYDNNFGINCKTKLPINPVEIMEKNHAGYQAMMSEIAEYFGVTVMLATSQQSTETDVNLQRLGMPTATQPILSTLRENPASVIIGHTPEGLGHFFVSVNRDSSLRNEPAHRYFRSETSGVPQHPDRNSDSGISSSPLHPSLLAKSLTLRPIQCRQVWTSSTERYDEEHYQTLRDFLKKLGNSQTPEERRVHTSPA